MFVLICFKHSNNFIPRLAEFEKTAKNPIVREDTQMKKLFFMILVVLVFSPMVILAKSRDCMFTALPVTCSMLSKLNAIDEKNEQNMDIRQAVLEVAVLGVIYHVDVNDSIGDYLISYFVGPSDVKDEYGYETLSKAFAEYHVAKAVCSFSISDEPVTLFNDKGKMVSYEGALPYWKNIIRLLCETRSAEIMADKRIFP